MVNPVAGLIATKASLESHGEIALLLRKHVAK